MVLINSNATCSHRERGIAWNVFFLTRETFHTINHFIYYLHLFSWYLRYEIEALYKNGGSTRDIFTYTLHARQVLTYFPFSWVLHTMSINPLNFIQLWNNSTLSYLHANPGCMLYRTHCSVLLSSPCNNLDKKLENPSQLSINLGGTYG